MQLHTIVLCIPPAQTSWNLIIKSESSTFWISTARKSQPFHSRFNHCCDTCDPSLPRTYLPVAFRFFSLDYLASWVSPPILSSTPTPRGLMILFMFAFLSFEIESCHSRPGVSHNGVLKFREGARQQWPLECFGEPPEGEKIYGELCRKCVSWCQFKN